MEIAHHGAVIGLVGECILEIVRVASQAKDSGAKVIELAEISVERAVLLHHEDDVVDAVLESSIWVGRRQRDLVGAVSYPLASGQGQEKNKCGTGSRQEHEFSDTQSSLNEDHNCACRGSLSFTHPASMPVGCWRPAAVLANSGSGAAMPVRLVKWSRENFDSRSRRRFR